MMLLCARMTEVSMSMGWYLIPRSSMASSRAPTTNRASCRSAETNTEAVSVFQAEGIGDVNANVRVREENSPPLASVSSVRRRKPR